MAKHATTVAEVALAPFNLRSDAIAHVTTDKDMEVLKDVHTLVSNKVSRNEVRKWVHRWPGTLSAATAKSSGRLSFMFDDFAGHLSTP